MGKLLKGGNLPATPEVGNVSDHQVVPARKHFRSTRHPLSYHRTLGLLVVRALPVEQGAQQRPRRLVVVLEEVGLYRAGVDERAEHGRLDEQVVQGAQAVAERR